MQALMARLAPWLILAGFLGLTGLAVRVLTTPVMLTVAIPSSEGEQTVFMEALSRGLKSEGYGIRLRIRPVSDFAAARDALESKGADIALIRPDIGVPINGMTVAVMRERVMLFAAPASSKIQRLQDIAGKRLAVVETSAADADAVGRFFEQSGLSRPADGAPSLKTKSVSVTRIAENDLKPALEGRKVDAIVFLANASDSAAKRILAAVRQAGADGSVNLFGIPNAQAALTSVPYMQAVTLSAGALELDPTLPSEDLATIGTTYRLMARAKLSRTTTAEFTQSIFEMRMRLQGEAGTAGDITRPPFEATADATTAKLPVHPGAIDYFEREQESWLERYESWIYLVAIFGGGLGSFFAWFRRRLGYNRRQPINLLTAQLLALRDEAEQPGQNLEDLAASVDRLAAEIADQALKQVPEVGTMEAALIAIDATRGTITRLGARDRPGSV